MPLTISVYEKRGLCRGPAIGNATFRAISTQLIVYDIPLGILTYPGPLGGATYRVQELSVPPGTVWRLQVAAPLYESWDFQVKDGETHEVWLSRRPSNP